MSHDLAPDEYLDTETGEIMTTAPADRATATAAIEPTTITTGAELARVPETFAELASLFQEQEPSAIEVARWILEPDQMGESDPEETTRAILARILSSETAEQVLATRDVVHAQDIIGEPIEVTAIKWQKSDHQQSSSCYVVMTGTRIGDATAITVTCGARNVMMQLLKLGMIDAFPARCRITKASKPTAAGYYPLWLEPA